MAMAERILADSVVCGRGSVRERAASPAWGGSPLHRAREPATVRS
jgi:hypothetical protein